VAELIGLDEAMPGELASKLAGEVGLLMLGSGKEDGVARQPMTASEHEMLHEAVPMLEGGNTRLTQLDPVCRELLAVFRAQPRMTVGTQRHAIAPRLEGESQRGAFCPRADHGQRRVPDFPPVAVRTVVDGRAEAFGDAVNRRKCIPDPRRQQHRMCVERRPIGKRDLERRVRLADPGDLCMARFDAVLLQLSAADAQELEGRNTVAGHESVERAGARVAGRPRVTQQDPPPAAPKDERGAETCRTAPDNHRVVHAWGGLQEGNQSTPGYIVEPALMDLTEFDFNLPAELVAQDPPLTRGGSRLLGLGRAHGEVEHTQFSRLGEYLRTGDVLVLNNTKVFPARLLGHRVPSGGAVECLLLREVEGDVWEALVHPGQKLQPGARMLFEGHDVQLHGEILSRHFYGRRTVKLWTGAPIGVVDAIDRIGHVPLPPYIKRDDRPSDRERYQTVYARERGSIAAPTAGLHLTSELLELLAARGIQRTEVTLHVGYGTFEPIRAARIEDHRVDPEPFVVTSEAAAILTRARQERRRVIAVGTTTVRVLESLEIDSAGGIQATSGEARLFIRPGHEFRFVDGLITNFHLPRSSLLVLVAAFAGRESILNAYHEAVARRYRFYSYGDAMLIL